MTIPTPANLPVAASRIRHSVCRWPYESIPLDEFCVAASGIGIQSVELLMPDQIPLARRHGLDCAMVSFPTGTTPEGTLVGCIEKAFNRVEHHDTLAAIYEPHLKAAANAGARHVICFPGNRNGLDDEQGIENCVVGLQRILPIAERLGITLVMELLNSRVDHPDYMADHSSWGTALCDRLATENFKLLYDIYHMQVMEGDIIATIRRIHPYIAHYHTGGCPGRNEINASQELNYPAIMRAIADTGYTGYVGQEFIPASGDPIASLREAISICSV